MLTDGRTDGRTENRTPISHPATSRCDKKRRGKLAAGVLLLHDNAPVHKSRVAQAAIHKCKFEQLNHPPYSPDLAPNDYYLL